MPITLAKQVLLGEMHGIGGEPGALIDACVHLAITDDLYMQFDIISTGNKTCTVQSQCSYLHDGLKNFGYQTSTKLSLLKFFC